MKKTGKPLILQTQVAYWFGKVGLKLENSDQEPSILKLEERTFETDQIIVSVGKRLSAIKSSLNFNYQLSSFVWLQTGIDYYIPASERSSVFIKDKSDHNNIFTDTRSYQLKSNDFTINQNEQSLSDEFPLDMGRWSFRLGVFIRL